MANSAVAAVIEVWNSLNATLFPGGILPTLYFDYVPQTDDAAAQLRLPYAVMRDEGFNPDLQSDSGGLETGTLVIEVYAVALADLDTTVKAVKWNGGSPARSLGLDFATLTLASPYYPIVLRRTNERRAYAGFQDLNNNPCHVCFLTYGCDVGLDANAV